MAADRIDHLFEDVVETIRLNAKQIEREMGKEQLILLAIEDITERKQMEMSLLESEEAYRLLTQNSLTGIYIQPEAF